MKAAFFLLAPLLSVSAHAQVGTYRPGAVTATVPATTPDACTSQCAGDAGCAAWNFIRVESGGVCEFLARDARPIASNISASGAAPLSDPASGRLLREGSSTVRIGSPAPVMRRAVPAATPRVPQRVVPRKGVPQRAVPVRRAPIFRHSVEGSNVIAPVQARPAPVQPPAPRAVEPTPQPVPPVEARLPAKAESPALVIPVRAEPLPPTPASRPQSSRTQSLGPQSLFGGLYDDVAMPAPADTEALSDAEAPVATSTRAPNLKGLAGGVRPQP